MQRAFDHHAKRMSADHIPPVQTTTRVYVHGDGELRSTEENGKWHAPTALGNMGAGGRRGLNNALFLLFLSTQ